MSFLYVCTCGYKMKPAERTCPNCGRHWPDLVGAA